MIKGSIQEEAITLLNIYAPNIEAPKYMKQKLTDINGEINGNTIIVGDINFSGLLPAHSTLIYNLGTLPRGRLCCPSNKS